MPAGDRRDPLVRPQVKQLDQVPERESRHQPSGVPAPQTQVPSCLRPRTWIAARETDLFANRVAGHVPERDDGGYLRNG